MDMRRFRRPMMRTAILAFCTTALSIVPMMAQDNSAPAPQQQDQAGPRGGGRGGDQNQVERLTKALNLTPDQVTQVQAIEDDSRKQAMAVRDDASIARPDKRAKMMEIRKAAQDKIRGVLTDDQKAKYDAMLAEMQQRMQNRGGGPGAPPAS
jgi:protein CpxP